MWLVGENQRTTVILTLLASISFHQAGSFVAPPSKPTAAARWTFDKRLGLGASYCCRYSLDATTLTTESEHGRRWYGASRGRSKRSSSGPLSASSSEEAPGDRRVDDRLSAAGVARGGEALDRGGGGTVAATAAGSNRVLGAATPVPSPGAEMGGGKDKDSLEWSEVGTECQKRVYICTNRWCMEKGSSATLGSFVGLAPEGEVLVQGVNCLGRCNKGPNVRVRQEDGNWLEFNRIENVERVYKILRDYLGADVSKEAALCLKYNFLANAALDRNEVTLAIDYYDKAIATGYADQQGVLLVMRATAFIQRAYSHGRALTDLLQKVVVDRPTQTTLYVLHELWKASGPSARMVLLGKFAQDCEGEAEKTPWRASQGSDLIAAAASVSFGVWAVRLYIPRGRLIVTPTRKKNSLVDTPQGLRHTWYSSRAWILPSVLRRGGCLPPVAPIALREKKKPLCLQRSATMIAN
ncbi:unnamed protein product [Pylaiella littoralis]